jgi:hypothetical protein
MINPTSKAKELEWETACAEDLQWEGAQAPVMVGANGRPTVPARSWIVGEALAARKDAMQSLVA